MSVSLQSPFGSYTADYCVYACSYIILQRKGGDVLVLSYAIDWSTHVVDVIREFFVLTRNCDNAHTKVTVFTPLCYLTCTCMGWWTLGTWDVEQFPIWNNVGHPRASWDVKGHLGPGTLSSVLPGTCWDSPRHPGITWDVGLWVVFWLGQVGISHDSPGCDGIPGTCCLPG